MRHPKFVEAWRRLHHPVQRWPAPDARWEKVAITEAKREAERQSTLPPYWQSYVELAVLSIIVVTAVVAAGWYALTTFGVLQNSALL